MNEVLGEEDAWLRSTHEKIGIERKWNMQTFKFQGFMLVTLSLSKVLQVDADSF